MNKHKTKSFAGQLKKAFIIVVLIPVLCIGGFLFYSIYSHIERQSTAEANNTIQQNYLDFVTRIESCEGSLQYLAASYSLQQFLTLDQENYLEIGRESKQIGELLYNILMTNQNFRSVTIYTQQSYRVLTNFLKNAQNVQDKEWYQTVLNSQGIQWWTENGRFYLGAPVMVAYPNKAVGVIQIEVRPEMLEDSFRVLQTLPVHVVVARSNKPFYQYTQPSYKNSPKLEVVKQIEDTQWTLDYKVDKSFYTNYVAINFVPVAIMVIVVVLLAWLITMHFFKRLAGELQDLVASVEQAQQGNLEVSIKACQFTELNILAQSIQGFLIRIKQLISQVYTKEIQRQELELNLLQAKISPHFLYNNLSAINWIALESGQDKICEITTELATFYRTALNKGKNIDKLWVEIENIKAYLHLQLIAHEYAFEVGYDIPDDLLQLDVPIFVLQPLVENSIEHGIHQLRQKPGKIVVSVKREGDWMKLQVWDNGTQLYQKIGQTDLPQSQYGYGTGNTHKRIQLLYGEKSGLTIHAAPDGTTATISFCPTQRHIFVD